MLCRTSKIVQASSGVSLGTPLLVPSFSSKAFGFSQDGQPEVQRVLDVCQEFITRTCLISAYDVYYNYVPRPEELGITVDLIFLDSGGYEVSEDRDLSAVDRPVLRPREWDRQKLDTIAACWPEVLPAVFVSYDHPNERLPVREQLRRAKEFRERHPHHLHTFLLKPQSQEESTLEPALRVLGEHITDLAEFDLVGVTEKELGFTVLERMVRIGRLRQALDAAGLSMPIHVFGALDPLSVSLYFVAGAEVFDGLTWVRYAYNEGQCVYIHNHGALKYGIEMQADELRLRTIVDNLQYLERVERSLKRFAKTKDWDDLTTHKDFLRQAAEKLQHQLGRIA